MLRDHCIFCWRGKKGENLVYYNMSQTLSIWDNNLMVFVLSWNTSWNLPCNMFWNLSCWILKNKNSRSAEIFVRPTSKRWAWQKFRETMKDLIHSSPCRTPCRLSIHEVFFGPLGLHLVGEVNLDGLHPFHQWELLDCNGHGPSILCVKWPFYRW